MPPSPQDQRSSVDFAKREEMLRRARALAERVQESVKKLLGQTLPGREPTDASQQSTDGRAS